MESLRLCYNSQTNKFIEINKPINRIRGSDLEFLGYPIETHLKEMVVMEIRFHNGFWNVQNKNLKILDLFEEYSLIEPLNPRGKASRDIKDLKEVKLLLDKNKVNYFQFKRLSNNEHSHNNYLDNTFLSNSKEREVDDNHISFEYQGFEDQNPNNSKKSNKIIEDDDETLETKLIISNFLGKKRKNVEKETDKFFNSNSKSSNINSFNHEEIVISEDLFNDLDTNNLKVSNNKIQKEKAKSSYSPCNKKSKIKLVKLKDKVFIPSCAICFEDIKRKGMINSCKHTFCLECINEWGKKNNKCPLCKKEFTKIIYNEIGIKREIKVHRKELDLANDEFYYEEYLEESIAENCLICDKSDNQNLLMICDECNYNVTHSYCDGFQNSIPEGEWFCKECRENRENDSSNCNSSNY